jgi:hypothetical protein
VSVPARACACLPGCCSRTETPDPGRGCPFTGRLAIPCSQSDSGRLFDSNAACTWTSPNHIVPGYVLHVPGACVGLEKTQAFTGLDCDAAFPRSLRFTPTPRARPFPPAGVPVSGATLLWGRRLLLPV